MMRRCDVFLDPEDPELSRTEVLMRGIAETRPEAVSVRSIAGGVRRYSVDGEFDETDSEVLRRACDVSYRPLEVVLAFASAEETDQTGYLVDGFASFVAPVVDRLLGVRVTRTDRTTQRIGDRVYVHLVPVVPDGSGEETALYLPADRVASVVRAMDPGRLLGYRFLTSDPLFFRAIAGGPVTVSKEDVRFFDGMVGARAETRPSRYVDGLVGAVREAIATMRQQGYQSIPTSMADLSASDLVRTMELGVASRSDGVSQNDPEGPYAALARTFGFQVESLMPLVYRVRLEGTVRNYSEEIVPYEYPLLPSQEEGVQRAEDLARIAETTVADPPIKGLKNVLPMHFGTPLWFSESADRIDRGLFPLFTFRLRGTDRTERADTTSGAAWERPVGAIRLWYAAVTAYAETRDPVRLIEQISVHGDGSASVPVSSLEDVVSFDSRLDVENMDRWSVIAYSDFETAMKARVKAVLLQSNPSMMEASRSLVLPYDGYYYLVSKVRDLEQTLAQTEARTVRTDRSAPIPDRDDWTSRGLLPFSFVLDGNKYVSGLLR